MDKKEVKNKEVKKANDKKASGETSGNSFELKSSFINSLLTIKTVTVPVSVYVADAKNSINK